MAKSKDNNTLFKGGGVDRIRRIFPADDQTTLERPLFDSVSREPARLSGVKLRFYSLRRAKNMDPLYREPVDGGDFEYSGPWEMFGALEFESLDDVDSPEATSEGTQLTAEARLQIARAELEAVSAPNPKQGDVIEFWDDRDFEKVPFRMAKFRYWDVDTANSGENSWSTATFYVWKLTLKHKTRFDAARKVEDVLP